MNEKLKPCPFCGGKAVIEVIEPHRHIICKMPVYTGGAFIECTECGGAISGETGTEATKKWNRRANDETD
jgi:Lar family restriction alleviation protein